MRQTELVSASRAAILEHLSASIGEINQPISALVLNAEAALQLLRAQPTNTGAVRRLLTCIVMDGLRTRTADWGHRSPHPCADREGAAGV
jgi:C4-dicarboxylate-specific signal transduction histidine kinase